MTGKEIEELVLTRDAIESLSRLTRIIMRIEALTDKRLNEAIDKHLDKLLHALRTRQSELINVLNKTICKE